MHIDLRSVEAAPALFVRENVRLQYTQNTLSNVYLKFLVSCKQISTSFPIDVFTVFAAILFSRQSGSKYESLYGNSASNISNNILALKKV